MPSQKTRVIEWLFFNRALYRGSTGRVQKETMTMTDIVDGIQATGVNLSTRNPANFWKDLTRGPNFDASWPASVFQFGYTGSDAIGAVAEAVFSFVPVPVGQSTPFPRGYIASPALIADATMVQSLSMPVATKALGRRDENWLAQVSARLAVIETHFALFSGLNIREVTFLQTGLKMRSGEVDIAYHLKDDLDQAWMLAVEAKGMRENIHAPQVLRAAQALAGTPPAAHVSGIIPFALKVVAPSTLYTVEFEPVAAGATTLQLAAEGVIRLVPDVPGIR